MNKPSLQKSLSSLCSQINEYNSSRSLSPVKSQIQKKRTKRKQQTKTTKINSKEDVIDLTDVDDVSTENIENIPWYVKFEPKSSSAVAIHKAKLKDVKEQLECMLNGESSTRIILLSGPSGSSKSTAIKALANELIPAYRSRASKRVTLRQDNADNYIDYCSDFALNSMSSVDHFSHFLNQAKYRIGSNLSLILVEELPNVFHQETKERFRNAILEWLYDNDNQLPPLVISLTECEIESDLTSSKYFDVDTIFTAETILGREILDHHHLKRIKFNPINTTLIRKHLLSICQSNSQILKKNEKWKSKDTFIKSLSLSTGDIRSAISALEFWVSSNVDLLSITRKEAISYFHAIGKVLYGSQDVTDDNEMINSLFVTSRDLVMNDNFKLGLLENYGVSNKGKFPIEISATITEALSESDTISSRQISLEYVIRKLRHTLLDINQEDSTHGKAKFPREWKIRNLQNDFKVQCEDYNNVSIYKYKAPRTMSNITKYDSFYAPLINKNRIYKKNSIEFFLNSLPKNDPKIVGIISSNQDNFNLNESIDVCERIGGEVKEILSEDNFVEDEKTVTLSSNERYRRKLAKLAKLKELYLKDEYDLSLEAAKEDRDMFDVDPIENDSDSESITEKTFEEEDDSLYEMLSQQPPKINSHIESKITESLSDSDLEEL